MSVDFVDGIGFKEAMAYAASRKVILPDDYYGKLIGIQRSQSVSVAGLAALEQIKFIVDQLAVVMKDGGTFKSFQDAIRSGNMGIELPNYRLDNIFRTNIQAAYSRGRWEQQMRVRGTRPYLMYDAINDSRVRPAHLAMDNTILLWDDPWWKTHYTPNGYRCRCTVISLSEAQAKKRGISNKPPDEEAAKPDLGWDYNPGEGYTVGPNIGLARTAEKLKTSNPKAPVDKAVKKIKEKTRKAGPVTLDEIMALGKTTLANLPIEPKELNTEFEKLMLTKVMGLPDRIAGLNRQAVAKRAKSILEANSKVTFVNPIDAGLDRESWAEKIYSSLPLPKMWLEKTAKRYKELLMTHSSARAFANPDFGKITMNHNSKDVVLHEFLHLVQEAMPELQTLCREMHLKRTENQVLNSLKTLTGYKGYADSEQTREDKYFTPYVGKEYKGTFGKRKSDREPLEILTMVLQALIGSIGSPAGKAGANALRNKLLSTDRESAAFGLGLLLHYA